MISRRAVVWLAWVGGLQLVGCGTDEPSSAPAAEADAGSEVLADANDAQVGSDASWPGVDGGQPPRPDAAMESGLDAPQPDAAEEPPGVGPNACPAAQLAPDPVDQSDLAPGPVTRYTVRPYYTIDPDGVTHDPVLTGDILTGGVWLVPVGHTLVGDSFQKNDNNKLCQFETPPEWTMHDPYCAIYRLNMKNPFLFKARAEHTGALVLTATIDGIVSNELAVEIVE